MSYCPTIPPTLSAAALRANPFRGRVGEFPGRLFSPYELPSFQDLPALTPTTPLIVELCSGSGQHIIELAKRRPQSLCIGFERRFKRAVRTIEKANRLVAENVYIVRDDVSTLFNRAPEKSVAELHVNFPDPWEKTRDRGNRFLNDEFFAELQRYLVDGGLFSFKTDHRDYFDFVSAAILTQPAFEVVRSTYDLHHSQWADENIITEFERLFMSQGLAINSLQARIK